MLIPIIVNSVQEAQWAWSIYTSMHEIKCINTICPFFNLKVLEGHQIVGWI